MSLIRNAVCAAVCGLCVSIFISADTLVLRDGRRVDGDLIAVRDGVIEFEAARGFGARDRLRLNRGDVVRIDLDSNDRGSFRPNSEPRGFQRPAGMRERDVAVEAARAWNDTGIEVRPGQTIFIAATGRVRWGPGREHGPEGEPVSPFNAARPMPSRPGGALIGRIGEGADYFFIGSERGPISIRSAGRLYLGINDDYLQDNSGSFRVTVYY
jgi:hypothetical protein